MISAFGVDHGISKSLSPAHIRGLEQAAVGGQPKALTHRAIYARARLSLRRLQDDPHRASEIPKIAQDRGLMPKKPAIHAEKAKHKKSMKNALAQASPYKNIGSRPIDGKRLDPTKRVLP